MQRKLPASLCRSMNCISSNAAGCLKHHVIIMLYLRNPAIRSPTLHCLAQVNEANEIDSAISQSAATDVGAVRDAALRNSGTSTAQLISDNHVPGSSSVPVAAVGSSSQLADTTKKRTRAVLAAAATAARAEDKGGEGGQRDVVDRKPKRQGQTRLADVAKQLVKEVEGWELGDSIVLNCTSRTPGEKVKIEVTLREDGEC